MIGVLAMEVAGVRGAAWLCKGSDSSRCKYSLTAVMADSASLAVDERRMGRGRLVFVLGVLLWRTCMREFFPTACVSKTPCLVEMLCT